MHKLRLYLVSMFNEKYNYFLLYLVFFWAKKCQKLKDQEVKDKVSTTFSEASNQGLNVSERISLVA